MEDQSKTIGELIFRMEEVLSYLTDHNDELRYFHATYTRMTRAVRDEIERGRFADPEWTERWDVAFASLYLTAVERRQRGEPAPGPWAVTFEAARDARIPPLRQVLLGMNAHINYDLPLSLLAVISDEEFDDPEIVALRATDHERIDDLLVSRVAEEDRELIAVEEPGDRTLLDRLLQPFNRSATKRFLKEARAKVWINARKLSIARRQSPDALNARLAELEELSRARVADLRAPGLVLLKLAKGGFGVALSD